MNPIIQSVNLRDEVIVLLNPYRGAFHLNGFSLAEGHPTNTSTHKFLYSFPHDCGIGAMSNLHIYTCPGKYQHKTRENIYSAANHDNLFVKPYIAFTNINGTLKRKEVLNNSKFIKYAV